MNFAGHNIRTNLQEQKSRLARTTYTQFGNQLKYFMDYLSTEKHVASLLQDAKIAYPMSEEDFERHMVHSVRNGRMEFENEVDQAAFNYQFLSYYVSKHSYNIHNSGVFQVGRNFDESKERIIENNISPILNYLHDRIDKSNSVLYLLEKYKRRTEWFTRKVLYNRYITEQKNFEQIFEDDLRLFLFDQGIEYPFSTPHSPSGRADVIGNLDTDDPIVVEIKLFDRERNYRKDRIQSGLSQIIKYARDYNKHVGYLVIFNLDTAELDFKFGITKDVFPPYLEYNGKLFYFIVINVAAEESASKIGKTEIITVTSDELVNQILV